MAFSKSDQFALSEVQLANFARSMAHPARIRIVGILLEAQQSIKCGDLVDQLPLAQSTVSQHIKELVDFGILKIESDGSQCRYSIDNAQLLNFCRSFQIAMGNGNASQS